MRRTSLASILVTTAPLIAVLALCCVAVGALWAPARATDVHGDDERDVYVGTGGLILPGSVEESTRRTVAGCSGCSWRLTSPCVETDLGTPFDGQSPCLSVVRGCPGGARLLRAWFRPAAEGWREIGLICVGTGGPVTVADVRHAARDRVERGIPPLDPTFQPVRGAVTQVPVLFDSGQPAGPLGWHVDLLGQGVDLVAWPEWTWQFGDGSRLRTAEPGGHYPLDTVAHTYRFAGDYEVVVTAWWSARFTVAGLGPFPVPEPITQVATRPVPVGQGRALLTPG